MTSLDDIQRHWHLIEYACEEGKVPAQVLDSVTLSNGQPLLAVDSQQQRHFLIPISKGQHQRGDQQSAGIHLLINEWGIDGRQRSYADLVCRKSHLNDVFDLVIYDISKNLLMSDADPVQLCHQVLNQWRELLNRDADSTPNHSTIVGVFGELWVLCELTRRDPRAVQLWIGPKGTRHDFYNGTIALEVKSSLQRRSRIITIHGHDQLDAPPGGGLYLILLQLEETPSGGFSVEDLVNELISLGGDYYELMSRLARMDITQQKLAALSDTRFQVLNATVYHVDDSFPRIINSSFANSRLPKGVVALNYQIDLSSTPPYPLPSDDLTTLYSDFIVVFEHGT